ncbi:MucBP domain-containing protein [Levilactobacillus tongjiangensis]|uniref:MucBP domain-containing protein n=1 Tax=Levilactobacillus tongjiangensis TaxID=2486023 RepID=A0ABW1SQN7_9LACO|nr:MucBP domain-containing protein [Levilactobacillus tongjiangensis]
MIVSSNHGYIKPLSLKTHWVLAAIASGILLGGGTVTVGHADSIPDNQDSETSSPKEDTSSAPTKSAVLTSSTPSNSSSDLRNTNSDNQIDDSTNKPKTEPVTNDETTSDSHKGTTPPITPKNPVNSDTPAPVTAENTIRQPNRSALLKAATPADDQIVTIKDASLTAAVKSALGLTTTGSLTVGAIRQFKGTTLTLNLATINDMSGLDALQYLPSTALIDLTLTYSPIKSDGTASPYFDLTPLTNLRFTNLSITDYYSGYLSDDMLNQLTRIDPTKIARFALRGNIYSNDYQALQNRQLALLAPWLTIIGNNGYQLGMTPLSQIDLSGNNLSDFSPLGGIKADTQILAIGESFYSNHQVNVVIGQPVTLIPDESYGLDGQLLANGKTYSFNTADVGTYTPITNLNNGQIYFDNPQQITSASFSKYITYGQLGFIRGTTSPNIAYIKATYAGGAELIYDTRIFRLANWQASPTVTISFTDEAGSVLQNDVSLGAAAKLGETYDLTALTQLKDYQLVAGQAAKLRGVYTLDPQAVTLVFKKQALTPTTPTSPIAGFDITGNLPTPPVEDTDSTDDHGTTTAATIAQQITTQTIAATAATAPAAQTQPVSHPQQQEIATIVVNGGSADAIDDTQAALSPEQSVSKQNRVALAANVQTAQSPVVQLPITQKSPTRSNPKRTTKAQTTLPQTSDRSTSFLVLLGLASLLSLSWLGKTYVKRN